MPINKRPPEFLFTEDTRAAYAQFSSLSKSDWCDLYYDLYRQVFGETNDGSEVMADVAQRIEILRRNRGKQ